MTHNTGASQRVLAILQGLPDREGTSTDCAKPLGLDTSLVSAHLRNLEKGGQVARVSQRTVSGQRPSIVYRATGAARTPNQVALRQQLFERSQLRNLPSGSVSAESTEDFMRRHPERVERIPTPAIAPLSVLPAYPGTR